MKKNCLFIFSQNIISINVIFIQGILKVKKKKEEELSQIE